MRVGRVFALRAWQVATSHKLAGTMESSIKQKEVSFSKPLFVFPLRLLTLGGGDFLSLLLMRVKTQTCCKADGNITVAIFKKLVIVILSTITAANHKGSIRHKWKLVIVF